MPAAATVSVTIMILRRSTRSARAPAIGSSSTAGSTAMNEIIAKSKAEPVCW